MVEPSPACSIRKKILFLASGDAVGFRIGQPGVLVLQYQKVQKQLTLTAVHVAHKERCLTGIDTSKCERCSSPGLPRAPHVLIEENPRQASEMAKTLPNDRS